MLGFREIGSTNSVVVDIGSIATLSSPHTFLINAGSTLTAQYGSGFATNANVFFSLSSTANDTSKTNYVTSAEYSTGPNAGPAKVFNRLTSTNSTSLLNKINSFGTEFTNVNTFATTPSTVEVEPNTDPNAYQNFMPGGTNDAGHANGNISYGYFNPTIEGAFDQGATGVKLDLIQLLPGAGAGNDLGVFQLSTDGNTLTYTPNAVPEPSTCVATAVLGALAFLGFRMNKARKTSIKEQSA